jgi:chorismate mutase
MKAVRGATVSLSNTEKDILAATSELLNEIFSVNEINLSEIVSIIFTSTSDITAAFPGKAVREIGLGHISVLDTLAPHIQGDIPLCIRVMLNVNTTNVLNHVYLGEAKKLRPDR